MMCVVVAVGCGHVASAPAPASCQDGPCPDGQFCDRDGAITGNANSCTAVSCTAGSFETCSGDTSYACNAAGNGYDKTACGAGCDAALGCRPFCTANQVQSCASDKLVTCNAEGTAHITEDCAMGCAGDGQRCLTFEPTNGLGPSLVASKTMSDVVFPAGTRIDANLGLVQNSSGTTIPVETALVNQAGAGPIRVFKAKSFAMQDVTITGTNAVAFVAHGAISIAGKLAARAVTSTGGPGSQSNPACNGADRQQYDCICAPTLCEYGVSGAGNAQTGGSGGGTSAASSNGGGAQTAFSPLVGGCQGGTLRDPSNVTVIAPGGGGGGAVQLVSLTSVTFMGAGLIDVGAGGGRAMSGGGSGGTVIIEAPRVTFSGATSGIAANGGAGGGCGQPGPDATANNSSAVAPSCSLYFGGNGQAAQGLDRNACLFDANCSRPGGTGAPCPVHYGGGGGSYGRLRVVTKSGNYEPIGGPILSVGITTASITPK